jgi:hypothetical protein
MSYSDISFGLVFRFAQISLRTDLCLKFVSFCPQTSLSRKLKALTGQSQTKIFGI